MGRGWVRGLTGRCVGRVGLGQELHCGHLDGEVGSGAGLDQLVIADARARQGVAEDRGDPRRVGGRGAQLEPGDAAADAGAALGLGLVDRGEHVDRELERRRIARRGDRGELGGARPGRAMDRRLIALLGERPAPDLLGDERDERREQPEQDVEPEPQGRDRAGAPGGVAVATCAGLGELEVGVGEPRPEELLGVLERLRVVELVEARGGALDEGAQLGDERAIELAGDRARVGGLGEDELAGVEQLGEPGGDVGSRAPCRRRSIGSSAWGGRILDRVLDRPGLSTKPACRGTTSRSAAGSSTE